MLALASCGGGETPEKTPADASSSAETGKAGEQASAAAEQDGKSMADAGKEQAAATIPEAKTKAAKALFDSFCFTCHGTGGNGDGPAVTAAFQPKPAKFTDATWQASVTDEELLKVIIEGGPAVGKSPLMVAAPGAKDDPELAQALLAIVRGFGS